MIGSAYYGICCNNHDDNDDYHQSNKDKIDNNNKGIGSSVLFFVLMSDYLNRTLQSNDHVPFLYDITEIDG